ncbi:MAG: DUF192 domain-containing protein [Patescibacteria group bacterium]
MQDKKNNFALYIILVMVAAAMLLKIINHCTKTGEVIISKREFKVEIAKNQWDMDRGLSGKNFLKDNKGMLFVFSKPDYYSFWMKGMKFSIDIIWINEGKIAYIKEKAPIPITQYIESYKPEAPAGYALEINAGLVEKYGFKIGDAVQLDI